MRNPENRPDAATKPDGPEGPNPKGDSEYGFLVVKIREGGKLTVGDVTFVFRKLPDNTFDLKISNLKQGDMILAGESAVRIKSIGQKNAFFSVQAKERIKVRRS